MYSLSQLEKQQIGLRLPKYLIDEVDSFTKEYAVNRTDIVIEALKSYLQEQKIQKLYENLDKSAKEAKQIIDGELPENSLQDLIDDLQNNTNTTI
jgi:hypothetical protein